MTWQDDTPNERSKFKPPLTRHVHHHPESTRSQEAIPENGASGLLKF
jgi:hypothetical protein